MTASPRTRLAYLLGILLAASGCGVDKPTYPKSEVVKSLQQILAEDHLNGSVRFIDHTLAVQVAFPDALAKSNDEIGIGPGFDEVTRRVLTHLHRVLLSSDARIDFYVLLLSDPNVPGAYLTMVRYVDDVKRANANMLNSMEMFERTIFELNFVGDQSLTLEQYVPRDIMLEEFLSWQLARRIQSRLTEELGKGAAVGRCAGRFQDGEFAFTLDVTPTADQTLDEGAIRKLFETSTNEIAKVLSSYRFEAFETIRLIHPMTGRNFVLPKTRLHVFQ